LRFEDPTKVPDKQETDGYDRFSLHCLLLHKASEKYAGCVRLVRVDPAHPDEPLPFERLCKGRMYDEVLRGLVPDRRKVGEISRLAVRASFRRRKGESNLPGGVVEERRGSFGSMRTPWIALGLYFSAAAVGLIKGLDGVFALMEPRLARRLATYGLAFRQVGDPVEHRGERAPFYISRADLYAGLPAPLRGLLEVIESDLRQTGAETMGDAPTTPVQASVTRDVSATRGA
jgi:N-acyl amino acid synthase of PEP-CTERM/exosortase system